MRAIQVGGGGFEASRTLRGLHDQCLAVLAHSTGIVGLHPGHVRAVEVETVHRADGLCPHVDFLQRHTALPVTHPSRPVCDHDTK